MSETMLLRLAKAIADGDETLGERDFGWDHNPAWFRDKHMDTARAALEAIREIDDEIADFGTGCISWRRETDTPTANSQMRDAFSEMITAILSQPQEAVSNLSQS